MTGMEFVRKRDELEGMIISLEAVNDMKNERLTNLFTNRPRPKNRVMNECSNRAIQPARASMEGMS